jgi:hypothetical protein
LVGNLVDREGAAKEGLVAVFVPQLDIGPILDPMSREVLMSVADLMRLHVDEVVGTNPTASPVEIVSALHDKLRNSLFVSDIQPERSHEIGPDSSRELIELLERVFTAAVRDAGWAFDERPRQPAPLSHIPRLHQVHRFDRPVVRPRC